MGFNMGSFAGSAASALIGGAASVIGAGLSYNKQRKLAEQQYKYQKEFAQNGIQWKTRDAIAAGLHPLYALGASSASYSPSGITDGGMGDAFSQFGQNMGRAVQAGMTYDERKAAEEIQSELQQAQLAKIKADTAESEARTDAARRQITHSYIQDQMNVMQYLASHKRVTTPHNPPQPSVRRYSQVSFNPSRRGTGVVTTVSGRKTPTQVEGSHDSYTEDENGNLFRLPSTTRSQMTQNLGFLGAAYDAIEHAGRRGYEILKYALTGQKDQKAIMRNGWLYGYDPYSGKYIRTIRIK